jgi:hypothetical protein
VDLAFKESSVPSPSRDFSTSKHVSAGDVVTFGPDCVPSPVLGFGNLATSRTLPCRLRNVVYRDVDIVSKEGSVSSPKTQPSSQVSLPVINDTMRIFNSYVPCK